MIDYKQRHIDYIKSKVAKEIETLEDGYKVWWPLTVKGYTNAEDLRIIADYLDELNKDWDMQVAAQL